MTRPTYCEDYPEGCEGCTVREPDCPLAAVVQGGQGRTAQDVVGAGYGCLLALGWIAGAFALIALAVWLASIADTVCR